MCGVHRRRNDYGSAEPPEVEALLVTHPINMRYLVVSRETWSPLVSRDAVELAVDPRYSRTGPPGGQRETAIRETRRKWEEASPRWLLAGLWVIDRRRPCHRLPDERWLHALPRRPQPFREVTLRAAAGPEEIAAIEQAVASPMRSSALRDWLRPGVTELEAAWFVESYVRTYAAKPWLDPIIAAAQRCSGSRSPERSPCCQARAHVVTSGGAATPPH